MTPGLINTHHHIYQNLTRAYRPATNGNLFDWLTTLYPLWSRLDEEAAYVSAWVGLAELALGRLHHLDRPPLRPPRGRRRPHLAPRSPPPASWACASTRPGAR